MMGSLLRWAALLCFFGVLSAGRGFVDGAAGRGVRALGNGMSPLPTGVTYSVECARERMSARIAKSLLLGFGASALVMNSAAPGCALTDAGPFVSFNISLQQCGTAYEETSTDLVFSQTISLPNTTFGMVTYNFVYIMVNAICKIPRTWLLSSSALHPNVSKLVLNQTSYAELQLRMDFYKTSHFLTPYLPHDYPLLVQLRQILYLQMSLRSGLDLTLFTIDLYATPTSDPFNSSKYYLVRNGCLRDSAVNVTVTRTVRRFTFPAFAFTAQDAKFVFVHAVVIACRSSLPASRCQQGCLPARRRRSGSGLETVDTPVYIFTRGPFVYSKEAALSRSDILDYAPIVALAAAACVVVFVVLGFAAKMQLAKK